MASFYLVCYYEDLSRFLVRHSAAELRKKLNTNKKNVIINFF